MRKPFGLGIAILVASWSASGWAIHALASCASLPAPISETIASAAVVFVGTVTGTSDGDRTATVHVDELWRGPSLAAEVTVHGSPDASAAATSVDRRYQNGKQYLFIPASANGAVFDDNSCSPTREFSSDLTAYRPADARRYPPSPAGQPIIPIAAAALVATAAGVMVILFCRRRTKFV